MAANAKVASLSVKIGSTWTTVAEVGTATISVQRGAQEVTEWDNNDAKYLRGVSRTTVQFECYWDVSVSTHTKFESDVITAAETEIRFGLSYPPTPTVRIYEGKCVVTGYEITARNGDLIRANITVQMATGMTVS